MFRFIQHWCSIPHNLLGTHWRTMQCWYVAMLDITNGFNSIFQDNASSATTTVKQKKHGQQTVNGCEVNLKSGELINTLYCKVLISVQVFRKIILKKVAGNYYKEYENYMLLTLMPYDSWKQIRKRYDQETIMTLWPLLHSKSNTKLISNAIPQSTDFKNYFSCHEHKHGKISHYLYCGPFSCMLYTK